MATDPKTIQLVEASDADHYICKATEEAKALLDFFRYPTARHMGDVVCANEISKREINDVLRNHPLWDELRHSITIDVEVDGVFDPKAQLEFRKWLRCITTYVPTKVFDENGVDMESAAVYSYRIGFVDGLWGTEQFVNEDVAECANQRAMAWGMKPVFKAGQKQSRIIGALCRNFGIDRLNYSKKETFMIDGELHTREKSAGYNALFAAMADSYNLAKRERCLTLSTNINDYLLQSIGTSWSSCMNIDKQNLLRTPDGMHHYSGMYSGGVLSYATDKVTLVATYITPGYEGGEPQLCMKEHRCLFFFNPNTGVLGQSRVYPDGRDGGEPNIAKEMRNIVQKAIAQCLGVPNLWKVEKGTSAYDQYATDEGVQYGDYNNYSDVNVSILCTRDESVPIKIHIGNSDQICPCCGHVFEREDAIMCYNCYSDCVCEHCGCALDRDDAYTDYDNEHVFCSVGCAEEAGWCLPCDTDDGYLRRMDNCHYCESNERWYYYDDDGAATVDGDDWFPNNDVASYYGYVYAVDEGLYAREDDCSEDDYDGDWYYNNQNGVYVNGYWYHNEENANRDGYVHCVDDDEWHDVDECVQTNFGDWYHDKDILLAKGYVYCWDTGLYTHHSHVYFNYAKQIWQSRPWSANDMTKRGA